MQSRNRSVRFVSHRHGVDLPDAVRVPVEVTVFFHHHVQPQLLLCAGVVGRRGRGNAQLGLAAAVALICVALAARIAAASAAQQLVVGRGERRSAAAGIVATAPRPVHITVSRHWRHRGSRSNSRGTVHSGARFV